MKKITVLTCIFMLWSQLAFAHPPTNILVNFDPDEKLLIIWVTHKVRFPDQQRHFVNKLKVVVNGFETLDVDVEKNLNENVYGFSYTWPLDLKKGDELAITAVCNVAGFLTKKIIMNW